MLTRLISHNDQLPLLIFPFLLPTPFLQVDLLHSSAHTFSQLSNLSSRYLSAVSSRGAKFLASKSGLSSFSSNSDSKDRSRSGDSNQAFASGSGSRIENEEDGSGRDPKDPRVRSELTSLFRGVGIGQVNTSTSSSSNNPSIPSSKSTGAGVAFDPDVSASDLLRGLSRAHQRTRSREGLDDGVDQDQSSDNVGAGSSTNPNAGRNQSSGRRSTGRRG
jgi:hypothetical protein